MENIKRVLSFVRRALDDYLMIEDGDKIAVGVSAGKDSLTLLCAMAEIRRFYPKKFDLLAITVDMGFEGMDFSPVKSFCEELGVEYEIVPTQISKIIFDVRKEKNPCSLCAKMRRGSLHSAAQEAGCNKVALGHHFDDVIETVLMSMCYSSEIKTMLPKLHSTNFEGMELIRPLYKVKEDDIISWANYNNLHFLQCACKFTEESTEREDLSKRKEIKGLIKEIKKINPNVDDNIFRSLHNVNLATLPGFRDSDSGEVHSFLEKY